MSTPHEDLAELESQLKPRPKSKAAIAKRYALMREIYEQRGAVRDLDIAEGRRSAPTRS